MQSQRCNHFGYNGLLVVGLNLDKFSPMWRFVKVKISFLTNTKLYDNLSKILTKLAKACWKLAPKLEISTNISWHASFLQLACKLVQMGKLPC